MEEMLQVISALGGVVITVVLVYLGHAYKESEKQAGLSGKHLELSATILEDEPHKPASHSAMWRFFVSRSLDISHISLRSVGVCERSGLSPSISGTSSP